MINRTRNVWLALMLALLICFVLGIVLNGFGENHRSPLIKEEDHRGTGSVVGDPHAATLPAKHPLTEQVAARDERGDAALRTAYERASFHRANIWDVGVLEEHSPSATSGGLVIQLMEADTENLIERFRAGVRTLPDPPRDDSPMEAVRNVPRWASFRTSAGRVFIPWMGATKVDLIVVPEDMTPSVVKGIAVAKPGQAPLWHTAAVSHQPGGSLRGRVFHADGTPAAGLKVRISPGEGGRFRFEGPCDAESALPGAAYRTSYVSEEGTFSISHLMPGESTYLTVIANGQDIWRRPGIHIPAGGETDLGDIFLPRLRAITVRVTFEGRGVPGIAVGTWFRQDFTGPGSSWEASTITDSDGCCVLHVMPGSQGDEPLRLAPGGGGSQRVRKALRGGRTSYSADLYRRALEKILWHSAQKRLSSGDEIIVHLEQGVDEFAADPSNMSILGILRIEHRLYGSRLSGSMAAAVEAGDARGFARQVLMEWIRVSEAVTPASNPSKGVRLPR